MAETIKLSIVTPDGAKLSEDVDELTAPSIAGEFGVLPGHVPLLAAVKPGVVAWKAKGGGGTCAIGWGFIEVSNDTATVLTDKFATLEAIDPVVVRAALKDADEKIAKFTGDPTAPEFRALVDEELWCAAQLELHGDPPPATVAFVSPYGQQQELVDEDEPTAKQLPELARVARRHSRARRRHRARDDRPEIVGRQRGTSDALCGGHDDHHDRSGPSHCLSRLPNRARGRVDLAPRRRPRAERGARSPRARARRPSRRRIERDRARRSRARADVRASLRSCLPPRARGRARARRGRVFVRAIGAREVGRGARRAAVADGGAAALSGLGTPGWSPGQPNQEEIARLGSPPRRAR